MMPVEALLKSPIWTGRLTIIDPVGQQHVLEGASEGPEATIRINDKRILRSMLVLPDKSGADFVDARAVLLTEIGDRLVLGNQVARQPHRGVLPSAPSFEKSLHVSDLDHDVPAPGA